VYDNQLILEAISQADDIEHCRLNVIPDNSEKYKMVNFRGYIFLDSLSFSNAGLSKLASNLVGGNPQIAPRFHEAFSQKGLTKGELIRLTRKKVFPYKWFSSVEKLDNSVIPCREEFFNDLSIHGRVFRGRLRESGLGLGAIQVQNVLRISRYIFGSRCVTSRGCVRSVPRILHATIRP
jgi:hypothetical protein